MGQIFKTIRNHIVVFLLGMGLTFLVSGCGSSDGTESSGTGSREVQGTADAENTPFPSLPSSNGSQEELFLSSGSASPEPVLSAEESYKAVLRGTEDFIWGGKGNEAVNIENFLTTSEGIRSVQIPYFAIVDLDGDGNREVVLWIAINDNLYSGYVILRYQDGIVYGYLLYFRQFSYVKEDGTFNVSGGQWGGTGKLRFTEDGTITDYLFVRKYTEEEGLQYFINGELCTEEEYNDMDKQQDEKPDVTWYDFTEDNIDIAFENAF